MEGAVGEEVTRDGETAVTMGRLVTVGDDGSVTMTMGGPPSMRAAAASLSADQWVEELTAENEELSLRCTASDATAGRLTARCAALQGDVARLQRELEAARATAGGESAALRAVRAELDAARAEAAEAAAADETARVFFGEETTRDGEPDVRVSSLPSAAPVPEGFVEVPPDSSCPLPPEEVCYCND